MCINKLEKIAIGAQNVLFEIANSDHFSTTISGFPMLYMRPVLNILSHNFVTLYSLLLLTEMKKKKFS